MTRTRLARPRWARRLLVLTAIALIGLAGFGWFGLRRSVPSLDGQLRLAGLTAPVEILFDAYGVPHVYARDVEDAWFTVGFLHGRERLWQMELYRRASSGRLSEVLGPTTLRVEMRFIGLGLRRSAGGKCARSRPWSQVGHGRSGTSRWPHPRPERPPCQIRRSA